MAVVDDCVRAFSAIVLLNRRLKGRKCIVNKGVMFSFVYCMFYVLVTGKLKGVLVDSVDGATITQLCYRSTDDDILEEINTKALFAVFFFKTVPKKVFINNVMRLSRVTCAPSFILSSVLRNYTTPRAT